jgi:hypothetical protein
MWSYGDPNEPKADDPRFETEQKAIDAAVIASVQTDSDPILAVWEDDSGECTTLVWCGWVYSA